MFKPLSYLYSFFFRKKKLSGQNKDLSKTKETYIEEKTDQVDEKPSHVDIVEYLIKFYFINKHKVTFTSADIFKVIRQNHKEDIWLKTLTVQQLRRALYKLRLKNAIYKQQIVLDSQKESKYNIYCINHKYNW
jgi:hypothetical protein